jgi:uncharacterized membrane protein YebE (DUF533 family)
MLTGDNCHGFHYLEKITKFVLIPQGEIFMEISRPNQAELTTEEQQELEKLRAIIEQASVDGVITQGERERIALAMRSDGKVTLEELELVRTLITEKVTKGELVLDYL